MTRQIKLAARLEIQNAEASIAKLRDMGEVGERAIAKIEDAARAAKPESKALAAALDAVGDQVRGLGTDIPGISDGLRGMGMAGTVVAGGLALAASAAAALLVEARAQMEWAATLTDTAEGIGANVESLQAWRFAMEEVGGAQEDVDSGLKKLQSTIGAVRTGLADGEQLAALKELKLDPSVVASWTTLEQAIPVLADRFADVESAADRLRLAERLGFAELLLLLSQGAAGLKSFEDQARSLGVMVGQDVVKSLDEANRKMEVAVMRLRVELAPAAAVAAGGIAYFAGSVADAVRWVDQAIGAGRDFIGILNAIGGAQSKVTRSGLPPTERSDPDDGAMRGAAPTGRRPAVLTGRLSLPPPPRSATPRAPRAAAARTPRAASAGADRNEQAAARAASDAARAVAADQNALREAQLTLLRAQQALASDAQKRRALAQEELEIENTARLEGIAAQKDWSDATKYAATQAQMASHAAALQRIWAEEEVDQKEAAAAAQRTRADEAKTADERARTSRRLLDDAERAMLEAAADQALTRESALDAELAILDLLERRQLAEIETLDATNEAKEAAKAAVRAGRRTAGNAALDRNAGPLEAFGRRLELEGRNINDSLESIAVDGFGSLSASIMDVIDGTADLGDAFKSVTRSIIADLVELSIRQWIVKPLFDMIGGAAAGKSSGGGGFLGSVFSAAMGALGGGFRKASVPVGLPKANGGAIRAGFSTLVGERGPERIVVPRDGAVIPNHVMTALAGGGGAARAGGVSVTIHNAPAPARVVDRGNGQVAVVFARLDALGREIEGVRQSVPEVAMSAFGDARRRGQI